MNIKYLAPIALAVILAGCATSKPANVVPMAGGTYKTTGISESEDDALKVALASAESTCGKRNMRHVVSNQETKYKGVVSEQTNRNLNKASELASLAGVYIPGLGGDDDYQVTLTFACEA